MKQGNGWSQVIRFDDLSTVNTKELSTASRIEHVACRFANEVIDIFNHNTLPVRLACVAKLFAMVHQLGLAAFVASLSKLPYVEPNRFDAVINDKRLPLIHFTNEYPERSKQ